VVRHHYQFNGAGALCPLDKIRKFNRKMQPTELILILTSNYSNKHNYKNEARYSSSYNNRVGQEDKLSTYLALK